MPVVPFAIGSVKQLPGTNTVVSMPVILQFNARNALDMHAITGHPGTNEHGPQPSDGILLLQPFIHVAPLFAVFFSLQTIWGCVFDL